VLLAALSGCAGPSASGTYQSSASYDRLYAASLSAVSQVGYTVTSSNKADGLIVAQQGVIMGHGSTAGLNATVSDAGNTRILRVDFAAPPATLALGNFDENVAQYVSAVRSRVPDVRAYP
jgi:hypothetical protein